MSLTIQDIKIRSQYVANYISSMGECISMQFLYSGKASRGELKKLQLLILYLDILIDNIPCDETLAEGSIIVTNGTPNNFGDINVLVDGISITDGAYSFPKGY